MTHLFSFRFIFLLLLLLILDVCLVPFSGFLRMRPIFLYLLVLYASFHWSHKQALIVAVITGLTRDFVGSQPFGAETFVLFVAALILNLTSEKIEKQSNLVKILTSFVFVFSLCFFNYLLTGFLGMSVPSFVRALGISFQSALMTAAFTPLFFFIAVRWFHERLALKQYELF